MKAATILISSILLMKCQAADLQAWSSAGVFFGSAAESKKWIDDWLGVKKHSSSSSSSSTSSGPLDGDSGTGSVPPPVDTGNGGGEEAPGNETDEVIHSVPEFIPWEEPYKDLIEKYKADFFNISVPAEACMTNDSTPIQNVTNVTNSTPVSDILSNCTCSIMDSDLMSCTCQGGNLTQEQIAALIEELRRQMALQQNQSAGEEEVHQNTTDYVFNISTDTSIPIPGGSGSGAGGSGEEEAPTQIPVKLTAAQYLKLLEDIYKQFEKPVEVVEHVDTCKCVDLSKNFTELSASVDFLGGILLSVVNHTQTQIAYLNRTIEDLLDWNVTLSTRVALLEAKQKEDEKVIIQLLQAQGGSSGGDDNATAAAGVQKVIDWIKDHGIQVSKRWVIREEDDSGYLYVRDLKGTTSENDARYRLRFEAKVNL